MAKTSKAAEATARRVALALVGVLSERGPLVEAWSGLDADNRAKLIEELAAVAAPLVASRTVDKLTEGEQRGLLSDMGYALGFIETARVLAELHGEALKNPDNAFIVMDRPSYLELEEKARILYDDEVAEAEHKDAVPRELEVAEAFLRKALALGASSVTLPMEHGPLRVDFNVDAKGGLSRVCQQCGHLVPVSAFNAADDIACPTCGHVNKLGRTTVQKCECGSDMLPIDVEGGKAWRCPSCGAGRAFLQKEPGT